MRYESADDVRLRLHRTVVAHNGKPVMVDEVLGVNEVSITYLDSGKSTRVPVDTLDLDPSHLPLGYVTAEDGKVYVATRKPCRKYKQGLNGENFHCREVLGKTGLGAPRPRGAVLPVASRSVVNTMMGKFEELGKAFQDVRKGKSRVIPFSREWAVGDDGDMCVLYRGEVVGYVTDTAVRLLPERAYLKESLELCLNSHT